MSRQYMDKVHVGRRIQRQKNGDIYVLERTTKYDPKTKKTITIGQKLLGKIKPGSNEIVPTRPKCKPGEKRVVTIRKHTGLTDILEHVGRESGIDAEIRESFNRGDADKILSLARYWLATGGATLPHLEAWQIMHPLPYSEGMSEDTCSDLFKSVGRNEDGVQNYFKKRASHLTLNPAIALDSTTISSYSTNQIEARQGFNKDGDGLNTVKLLTLYSVKDREPIAFAKQPGNIPDVISIKNALSQLDCLGVEDPMIVTDNGYYSQGNMEEFIRKDIKFLTLVDTDITWIRNAIDELKDKIDEMGSVCPFDYMINGATLTRAHEFKDHQEAKLYVHVYHSLENVTKREMALKSELMLLKKQIEEGVKEFTVSAQKKIDKYLIISRTDKVTVEFNEKAIAEAKKYFGYFALVGNQQLSTFEALENYRLREKIEEFFAEQKGSFDSRRTRVWYPDSLRGRQFVQFVGLGYHCYLRKRLKDIEESLGQNANAKTKGELAQENKLKAWLSQRSLAQILEWFDCIETTQVETKASVIRWSTESTQRDRLLLSLLGVIPPS